MSKRFTELIELNQIDINNRIDDVINKIASDILYVMTRPFPYLNYDNEIIAIIEDVDLELRYAKVKVCNASEIMDEDGKTLKGVECFETLEELKTLIRIYDRNLYNETLSYEKWLDFINKLTDMGTVRILHYTKNKNIKPGDFSSFKIMISLSENS